PTACWAARPAWTCGSTCRTSAAAPTRKRRRAPAPRTTRRTKRCGASFGLRLAPYQRVGVAFQVIHEDADAARRTGDFLQRVAQILRRRRIPAEERRIRVFDSGVGVGDRAAQVLERLRAFGDPLRIDAVDERARIVERLVER